MCSFSQALWLNSYQSCSWSQFVQSWVMRWDWKLHERNSTNGTATTLAFFIFNFVCSFVMTCFERLVLAHLKGSLPLTLEHFAQYKNRCTEDAVCAALRSHVWTLTTHLRMLIVDFSIAFIKPSKLTTWATYLGISISLCSWILHFLTIRSQNVSSGRTCFTFA